MNSILYLVHRLPYPPNKGDKITSYNLLKYLSKRYKIYLACFIDDPDDWQYLDHVESFCEDMCVVNLNPKISKVLSIRGLFTGEALSIPYYRNNHLQLWVDNTLEQHNIDSVLIFSGVMAQYVTAKLNSNIKSVLDLEDVDSDKWRLYAKDHSWPMNWIYRREADKLLAFETSMAEEFDASVFVSKDEADFFKSLAPTVASKVEYRVQGVDSEYFDPKLDFVSPYNKDQKVIVFTGAMDYWPNINAAIWFSQSIFPKIREKDNSVCFYIVGMSPAAEVTALANAPGVFVTGGVPDVRPFIFHAEFSVIPLRLARGIQNKVLEAMAMQKAVLATSNALQGIISYPGFTPLVANEEEDMIQGALSLLSGQVVQDVSSGRECVLNNYNWDANLRRIESLLI